jgi:hypothetical protein
MLTLEHAEMIARWFNLQERNYKTLPLDTLITLVKQHFIAYKDQDITRDIEAILLVIK